MNQEVNTLAKKVASNIQPINKLIGYEMYLYRYRRRPLLLVQVNIENKDILCIYTSIHGQ